MMAKFGLNFNSLMVNHAFLADPYSYDLMMNLDWFRPYKHLRNYSIGAIYVVFINSHTLQMGKYLTQRLTSRIFGGFS